MHSVDILDGLFQHPTAIKHALGGQYLLPVDCCHGTTIVISDCTIVTSEHHLYQIIVQIDKTIVLPRKLPTGNIHDYLFATAP